MNTVTQAAGKVGNAAQFTAANSKYLTISDNAALSMGDIDFTVSAWVNFTSTARKLILGKGNASGPGDEYYFDVLSGGTGPFLFSVGNGTTARSIAASSVGTPSTGVWYFLVGWHDSVADTVSFQVNNGTIHSSGYTGGSYNSAFPFSIGRDGSFNGLYMDGLIDQVAIWKRVLTAPERATLYNGGNGLAFSQFSGTYTLSGTGTAQAATGSGAGLINTNPVYSLSGSGQPQSATGSGAGLTNTAPVYSLSGIASAQPATGSGTGLVTTAPVYSLSGQGQADAATGSGAGLIWIPDVIPVTIVVARARPLMVAGVARPLTFRGVAQ